MSKSYSRRDKNSDKYSNDTYSQSLANKRYKNKYSKFKTKNINDYVSEEDKPENN